MHLILEISDNMKSISSYLPITKWARTYNKDWLRLDIIAGITVGAFIIPESIAYVSLANLPPEVGLYSAMVAVLVYMIFGTSRQLSLGPLSTLSISGWFHTGFSDDSQCCPVCHDRIPDSSYSWSSGNIILGFKIRIHSQIHIKTSFNWFSNRYSIIYCIRPDIKTIWNIRWYWNLF